MSSTQKTINATILLCGGGTGGHITPTLHIARALKTVAPSVRLVYVIEKGSKFSRLVEQNEDIDKLYAIPAGKFRRYHGRSKIAALFDVGTNWLNTIDFFRTLKGIAAARRIIRAEAPSLLFAKGGFVGVPMGVAAHRAALPIITHDSDEQPGLANRIIGRWAEMRLVTSDMAAATYGHERTEVVGIPIDPRFAPVDKAGKQAAKRALGVDPSLRYVTVIGGSLGAQNLNAAVRKMLTDILVRYRDLAIVWVVGAENETSELEWLATQPKELSDRVLVRSFIDNVSSWFAASEVIISRAGATTTAEILAAGKPSILIPAAFLPGGHQVQNAEALAQKGAVRIVYEQEDVEAYATMLEQELSTMLDYEGVRNIMQERALSLATGRVAERIATLILDTIEANHA